MASLQPTQRLLVTGVTHCHWILLYNSPLTPHFLEAHQHRLHTLPQGGDFSWEESRLPQPCPSNTSHQTKFCNANPTFPLTCNVKSLTPGHWPRTQPSAFPFKNVASRPYSLGWNPSSTTDHLSDLRQGSSLLSEPHSHL